MRVMPTISSLLMLSACVTATDVAKAQTAQPTAQQVTVPLSDPSRPGTLRVNLTQGGVTIRGTNRKDLLIEAQGIDERRRRRSDDSSAGLRRLVQSGGFEIEEDNNQVRVTSSPNHSGTSSTST